MRTHKGWTAVAAAAGLLVALGACSTPQEATGNKNAKAAAATTGCTFHGHTVKADPALTAKLPASVRDAKTLSVATDPSSPPYEYYDGKHRLDGVDVEMAQMLGCQLGVRTQLHTLAFASILTAVQSGRYDMGVSSISDTGEREKVMNFVDYQTEGTAIVVPRDNPHHVKLIGDLCGHKVVATAGSITEKLLTAQNARCATKMTLTMMPNAAQGYLAVRSGRADAFMDTYGTARYTAAHPSGSGRQLTALTTKRYAVGYQSVALAKNADGKALGTALVAALGKLKASGAYHALYTAWGLTLNELETPTMNDSARYDKSFLSLD